MWVVWLIVVDCFRAEEESLFLFPLGRDLLWLALILVRSMFLLLLFLFRNCFIFIFIAVVWYRSHCSCICHTHRATALPLPYQTHSEFCCYAPVFDDHYRI